MHNDRRRSARLGTTNKSMYRQTIYMGSSGCPENGGFERGVPVRKGMRTVLRPTDRVEDDDDD